MIQKIGQRFKNSAKEILLWSIFLTIGATVAYFSAHAEEKTSTPEAPTSLETFIPKDHLLIPIEISNADKLDGLLGAAGIVDLYQVPPPTGGPAKLVGRRLRLLRAPLNPNAFAVLLRESEADQFLASPGPYIASLRPLNERSHEISRRRPVGPRVDYQSGEE